MKVIMGAYSCGPDRGSEPGAGWAWARSAAQKHSVWVLTHASNRVLIEPALAMEPELRERLHPVYIQSPRWARWLRHRGPGRFLYCIIWQLTVCRRAAAELHKVINFDVSHHVTYASDWMPVGVAHLEGVPFVWGPVGGASTTGGPRLWALLGLRAFLGELWRAALLIPVRMTVGRVTAKRASHVLAQNLDVARVFSWHPAVTVQPHIALKAGKPALARRPGEAGSPVAMFAGRLLAWKGVSLGLSALCHPEASAWRLHVYGDGRERRNLERLAARLGLSDRVVFFGNRPRHEVQEALAKADALLFPSVHDAGGWSVAEAIEAGCPVVALEIGGPAVLVDAEDGVLVPSSGDVVGGLATALNRARGMEPHRGMWSDERIPPFIDGIYAQVTSTPGLVSRRVR